MTFWTGGDGVSDMVVVSGVAGEGVSEVIGTFWTGGESLVREAREGWLAVV